MLQVPSKFQHLVTLDKIILWHFGCLKFSTYTLKNFVRRRTRTSKLTSIDTEMMLQVPSKFQHLVTLDKIILWHFGCLKFSTYTLKNFVRRRTRTSKLTSIDTEMMLQVPSKFQHLVTLDKIILWHFGCL